MAIAMTVGATRIQILQESVLGSLSPPAPAFAQGAPAKEESEKGCFT